MKLIRLSWAVLFMAAFSLLAVSQGTKKPAVPAPSAADSQSTSAADTVTPNRGQAYYHYALAHMYEEMAMAYSNGQYANKAIEQLRQAMKYDPVSGFLGVELAGLYLQVVPPRVPAAIAQCEDIIKSDPANLDARRLLGRIYLRNLSETGASGGQRAQQEEMLGKALAQYEKIIAADPKDVESLLILGRLYRFKNENDKAEVVLKKALDAEPDNDEVLGTLAQLYSDEGDNKKAAQLLEKASQENGNVRLLAMLGQSYQQNHEYAKAIDAFHKALEQDKGNTELLRSLAQSLMLNGQFDEALQQYLLVVQNEPQDANAYLKLGELYRHQHNYPKALESLRKAKSLAPDDMEITYNLALLNEAQGSPEEAIRLLRKLLDDTSKPAGQEYTTPQKANRTVFLERLGFLYRDQEKYAESEAVWRQIIEMDPDNGGRPSTELVTTIRAARDFKRARAEADAAVKKYPKDVEVKVARLTLIADMGSVDEAVKEMKAMVAALDAKKTSLPMEEAERNDQRREILVSMVQALEHGRRFDDALGALKQVEALSDAKEQKALIYFLYGSVYERNGKFAESEQSFRKALELNPDDPQTLNYLGYMLADHGMHLEEAVKMIGRALDMEPQSGAYMDSLGWAYFKQSRYDLAEQYLLKAAQRVTHDATIRDHLGDLYFKTNRTKDAQREWQAALSAWQESLPGDTDPLDVEKVHKKLDEAKVRLAKEGNAK